MASLHLLGGASLGALAAGAAQLAHQLPQLGQLLQLLAQVLHLLPAALLPDALAQVIPLGVHEAFEVIEGFDGGIEVAHDRLPLLLELLHHLLGLVPQGLLSRLLLALLFLHLLLLFRAELLVLLLLRGGLRRLHGQLQAGVLLAALLPIALLPLPVALLRRCAAPLRLLLLARLIPWLSRVLSLPIFAILLLLLLLLLLSLAVLLIHLLLFLLELANQFQHLVDHGVEQGGKTAAEARHLQI
mmetsp:Transcript_20588/g.61994  ORF Transcript_20588/g.61994 Transcript_20588/m.61994 type:complete len:243 (+) Transcript_20588:1940-2668(+)